MRRTRLRRRRDPWHAARGELDVAPAARVTRLLSAPQVWTCECGAPFVLSERNSRAHRKRGTSPQCRACRFPHAEQAVSERERQAYLDWWLTESGLSLDELRDIASCLWPGGPPVSLSDAA